MSKVILFTVYPLSREYLTNLKNIFNNNLEVFSLSEIKTEGISKLMRFLWSIKTKVIIPMEDENSYLLKPILILLAGFTRSTSINIIYSDLKIEKISRWQVVIEAIIFFHSTISCLCTAYFAKKELLSLLKTKRIKCKTANKSNQTLYLKTNLSFGLKAGGSLGHIAGVINAFQRQNYKIKIVSSENPIMIDKDVTHMKIIPPRAFGIPYELNNLRFQKSLISQFRNVSLLNTGIIYQRLSITNYSGVILSRKNNLPLIVEYNGSEVWISKNWGNGLKFPKLATMAEDLMLQHAHIIVTISEVLRLELIERGVEPSRIVCYPNCIDKKIFNPALYTLEDKTKLRNKYNIPYDATVVTFVGTFGQWHGVDILAKAIKELISKEKEWIKKNKVYFLLVGDGVKMPQVISILGKHFNNKHIIFTGLVPQIDAPKYIAASNIVVSPHIPNNDGSKFFGSPTKLFEYMAMAKAVIASNLDQIGNVLKNSVHAKKAESISDIISNNRVSVLTKPGDVNELLKAIKFLVTNPKIREILGHNARKLVLKKYTWDNHIKRIISKGKKLNIINP